MRPCNRQTEKVKKDIYNHKEEEKGMAVGDITVYNNQPSVIIITWTFITDVSGDASEESETLNDRINRVTTIPDNIDTPIAGWDLTIEDEDGIDILCGIGANRDADGTGISEQVFPCPHDIAIASKLTFKIANAGDTKKGVVKLYIT